MRHAGIPMVGTAPPPPPDIGLPSFLREAKHAVPFRVTSTLRLFLTVDVDLWRRGAS